MTTQGTKERARETAEKLSNLPDEYSPGADGGLYHTVNTERGRAVIAAALEAERREQKAEDLLLVMRAGEELAARWAKWHYVTPAVQEVLLAIRRAFSEDAQP